MMNTEAHKKTVSLALLHGVRKYMRSRLCLMPKRKATRQDWDADKKPRYCKHIGRQIPSYVLFIVLLLQAIEVPPILTTKSALELSCARNRKTS